MSSMISGSGSSFSVQLHRFDTTSRAWVPVSISVDDQLGRDTNAAGQDTGLAGASFRIAPDPSYSEWFAKFHNTTLVVHERAFHVAAVWAPLVEKAHARYAERFGQYGGRWTGDQNDRTDAGGNAVSGYTQIDGGFAEYTYRILYGSSVVAQDSDGIDYTPGGDAVGANRTLIENLLRVQGNGVPAGQRSVMTVGTGSDDAVERLDAQSMATLGRRYISSHPTIARELRYLHRLIGNWRGEADAKKKPAALEKVAKAASALVKPGNWPILGSNRGGGDYKVLAELLSIVANVGTDSGGDAPTHTYASHSYTVFGASFKDARGTWSSRSGPRQMSETPRSVSEPCSTTRTAPTPARWS